MSSILDWFGRNLLAYPPQQGGDPSMGYANPANPLLLTGPSRYPGTQQGLIRRHVPRLPDWSEALIAHLQPDWDNDPRGGFALPPDLTPGTQADVLSKPRWDQRFLPTADWKPQT